MVVDDKGLDMVVVGQLEAPETNGTRTARSRPRLEITYSHESNINRPSMDPHMRTKLDLCRSMCVVWTESLTAHLIGIQATFRVSTFARGF